MTSGPRIPELRSLGLRSDLMVMRGLSETEIHPDRVVLRTPSEPDFWCGNMVIFRTGRIDPEAQIGQFHAALPEARHVALAWDVPGMGADEDLAVLEARGFEIDRCDVLVSTGEPPEMPALGGLEIRPIRDPGDWAQVVALQVETGLAAGYSPADHAAYVERRFENRRRQIAEGWGCWFGAFDRGQLVGDLGIFSGAGIARFQNVETRSSHRRRGICAALVMAGLDWARRFDPQAVPVIVADCGSPAGRIYRRCGFALAEHLVMAIRPPAG